MKKFQFAAGLLAAGLLASCSSDAPDMPNGGSATPGSDEEVVATLAVRIAPSVTRADDNEIAENEESKINGVRVYVVRDDQFGTRVFTGYTNTLENGTAKIAITKDRYDALTQPKEDGTQYKYKVYVVCNANENVTTLTGDQEIDGTTDGVNKIASKGNFTMTNASAAESQTLEITTADKSTIIVAPKAVKVDRLAVRYDYTAPAIMNIAGKDGETAKDFNENNGIKLEVAGATLENLNLKDYLFPHRGGVVFGAEGYWNTPSFAMTNVKAFSEYTYKEDISQYGFECGHPGDVKDTFNKFTYAAFKVKMDLSESKFKDMTGSNLFAVKHILLGNEEALKAENGFDTGDAALNKAIKELVESITYRAKEQKLSGDAEKAYFVQEWSKLSGYDVYSPDANDGNYYTYYAANITTDKALQIIRNHVYKLGINSFSRLGVPGNKTPEQQKEDLTSLFFQFSVEVNPWVLNTENNWDF